MEILVAEPLTPLAFAPFGEVISVAAAERVFSINSGTAQRYHDLARIDCTANNGRPIASIVRAQPQQLPFEVLMLERHPLGSQAFIPLRDTSSYLIVVAASPAAKPNVFLAQHGQGVNYRCGTWHHPLIVLNEIGDFLVIDRGGEGNNCDEVHLPQPFIIARRSEND